MNDDLIAQLREHGFLEFGKYGEDNACGVTEYKYYLEKDGKTEEIGIAFNNSRDKYVDTRGLSAALILKFAILFKEIQQERTDRRNKNFKKNHCYVDRMIWGI